MKQHIAHNIKHRKHANDEFYTPRKLASELVKYLPIYDGETVLEPCYGDGAFKEALPQAVLLNGDYYSYNNSIDWVVTNPPYSDLDRWLTHSFAIANQGVALLLGLLNVTPRRLEMANKAGFGLTSIHLCKVYHWFGISAFCVWRRGAGDIIKYDRTVWK